jgi:hypothetical protein
MSSSAGAMDQLKTRIRKSSRKRRSLRSPSRVQQFYEEFESSGSSRDVTASDDSDDAEKGTFFGYRQGDQSGRIFAHWVFVYFVQFFCILLKYSKFSGYSFSQ